MDSVIKFNDLWSNPTCSPARAGIITGKYGFRNGVLAFDQVLSTSEISFQNYIRINTSTAYKSAVIGKWHFIKRCQSP